MDEFISLAEKRRREALTKRYRCPQCGMERTGRKYCVVCTRKAFKEYGVYVTISEVCNLSGPIVENPELVVKCEELPVETTEDDDPYNFIKNGLC